MAGCRELRREGDLSIELVTQGEWLLTSYLIILLVLTKPTTAVESCSNQRLVEHPPLRNAVGKCLSRKVL